MSSAAPDPRVIVALDFPAVEPAREFVRRLDPTLCRLKVGKELFTRSGPHLVEEFVGLGYGVFLDLKFHDIPNTVAGACRAAADLGVWMINVHASGGRRMMEAAREALEAAARRPLLIAVTVLTSLDEAELHEVGFSGSLAHNVHHLAALARAADLDGVVCSPREAGTLRARLGDSFCLVTPGVRPASVKHDDQRRVMTPGEAIHEGAHYLVIGRPVTQAPDPTDVLRRISRDVADAVG